MFKKLKEFMKSKKVKALEEERDSYLEIMTETVQDTNDLQREVDGLNVEVSDLTKSYRAAVRQRDRFSNFLNEKVLQVEDLERGLLQSEKDYNELLDEKTEDRKTFAAAYQEIFNTLQNSADMTDLPVME